MSETPDAVTARRQTSSPPRTALVLVNRGAGQRQAPATLTELQEAFRKVGIQAKVEALDGRRLAERALEAAQSDVDIIVAGGGDGTVSTVAAALVGQAKPLGVLPLGTLNHFARDLKIPFNLDEAVAVVAEGVERNVDVGKVNGQVFINNSSLGIYPRIVLEREAHRARWGLSKWSALILAALRVFHLFPLVRVRLETGTQTIERKTPLVFVGNNIYELSLLNVGRRQCLDQGHLCLYIACTQTRFATLRLCWRALFGSLEQARDFEAHCLDAFNVESKQHRIRVALDGEVQRMLSPLHYEVVPRALRVIVPQEASEPPTVNS